MENEATKVGKIGAVIIPAALRCKYGFEEGSPLIAEDRLEGVLLRPAVMLSVEIYTPQRKAEFLLNNTISKKDYVGAVKEVKNLGVNPETIPHQKLKERL